MLPERLRHFFEEKNWWFADYSKDYADALKSIGVPLDSDFADFYLHVEDSPTFFQRGRELYQVCWFITNSNYGYDIERSKALGIPVEYLPLDSFEGEGGFFYDKSNGQVVEIRLGLNLENFKKGLLDIKWDTFSSFLEWYFEIGSLQ